MRVLLDFKVDIVNILFNGRDQIEPSNQKCNVVTAPLHENSRSHCTYLFEFDLDPTLDDFFLRASFSLSSSSSSSKSSSSICSLRLRFSNIL